MRRTLRNVLQWLHRVGDFCNGGAEDILRFDTTLVEKLIDVANGLLLSPYVGRGHLRLGTLETLHRSTEFVESGAIGA